jgi:hypothetical protein
VLPATAHDRVTAPTVPLVNVRAEENLRRALTLVLTDVSSWDQTTWGWRQEGPGGTCRTAYCVAGHVAVHVLGCPPVWTDPETTGTCHLHWVAFTEEDLDGRHVTWSRDVAEVAAEALNLSEARADALFSERRSLRRLVELAFLWTAGRVDLLADYDRLTDRDPGFATSDADVDASNARAAYQVVDRVLAGYEDEWEGLPLEDRLGDDRSWWEDELTAKLV